MFMTSRETRSSSAAALCSISFKHSCEVSNVLTEKNMQNLSKIVHILRVVRTKWTICNGFPGLNKVVYAKTKATFLCTFFTRNPINFESHKKNSKEEKKIWITWRWEALNKNNLIKPQQLDYNVMTQNWRAKVVSDANDIKWLTMNKKLGVIMPTENINRHAPTTSPSQTIPSTSTYFSTSLPAQKNIRGVTN